MSWLLRTKVYPLSCGEEERRSFSEGFLLFTLIRWYNYNQKYFSVKFSSTFLWSFFILTFLVQISIDTLLVFLTVKLTIYVDLFFTVEKRYKHHIDGFYYVLNVLMEWREIPVIIVLCYVWFALYIWMGIVFSNVMDSIENIIKKYKRKKFMKFLSSHKESSWRK